MMRTLRASSIGLVASLTIALSIAMPASADSNELALPALDFSEWIELDLDFEGFKALFPGKPDHGIEKTQTILGTVVASRYVYETPTEHYAVERHELPRLSRMLATAGLILDKTKEGILTDREADEVSYEEGTSSEYPMRVLGYRSRDGRSPVELTHIYLVGRDIYLITAESQESEESEAAARHFFESFELVERD
jgi:hypothetical protein